MGCIAQVWLAAGLDKEGRMRFAADSDSKIMRGFCYCLVSILDGAAPEEVLTMKTDDLKALNVGLLGGQRSRANTWHNNGYIDNVSIFPYSNDIQYFNELKEENKNARNIFPHQSPGQSVKSPPPTPRLGEEEGRRTAHRLDATPPEKRSSRRPSIAALGEEEA
ncbi:hypothetical protein F8388_018232 [Cannabis sativa]|uniref:Fe-S metabolism associated domain-containing protein n=1 Tax=Cannabis sativa TaxID=3483 RepID=A0A7J6GBC6_CANSA|nr:hypothetical protein F8388_018232 [Cannabis sativa]